MRAEVQQDELVLRGADGGREQVDLLGAEEGRREGGRGVVVDLAGGAEILQAHRGS